VLRTVAETHERVAFIAGSTERMMSFVEDTSRTFSGLPGAGLLGLRRPAGRPAGAGSGSGSGSGSGGTIPAGLPETVEGELLPPDPEPPAR